MNATRTPRKAAPKAATAAAPKAAEKAATDVAARLDSEDDLTYVRRLAAETPTTAIVSAMTTTVLAADDEARRRNFDGRVLTSVIAGLTLRSEAAMLNGGVCPKKFPDAARLVGVTDQNQAQWNGRAFSTLKECWTLATHHDDERMASFVDAWRTAHGVNPEAVRAYAQWCTAAEAGGTKAATNSVKTLATRKAAAEKVAKAAKEKAEARRKVAKAVADRHEAATDPKAKPISGCPLTKAQWSSFSEATLLEIETLAASLRSEKAEAARKAKAAAEKAAADSETGPKPKAKAATSVVA